MDEKGYKHEIKDILEKSDPKEVDRGFMDDVLEKIKRRREVTPQEVARAILFMADFPDREWNLPAIVGSMKSNLEEINWRDVYSCFLDVNFSIWTLESLYVIVDCWVHISGIITVPYEIFFKRWKNERAQMYFLRLIIESDEKRTQLYSNVFFSRIISIEDSRSHRFKNVMGYESNFNCVELFQCIGMLGSIPLVELIARKSPEWCAAGLGFVQPKFGRIFEDLLSGFARGAPNSFILHVLFKNHPEMMLQKSLVLIREGIPVSRILDMFLEHKMLPLVSELLNPPELCFDIIVLSSIRDHLNLGIWLSNNLTTRKDEFVRSLVLYLDSKISKSNEPEKMFPLNVEIMGVFTKAVEQYVRILKPETVGMYNEFKSRIPHGLRTQRSKEVRIEEEASNFISQIINSQRGIESSINQIKEFLKGNALSKVLASRIFSALLENYGSLYKLPNSDLIALLYGGLIKEGVFPKPYRRMAIEYIKGSLKYPENDREYSFGFRCLEVFLPSCPTILAEIEEIESVNSILVKKELILVDSTSHPLLDEEDIVKLIFKCGSKNERTEEMIKSLEIEAEGGIERLGEFLEKGILDREEVVLYIIQNIEVENGRRLVAIVEGLGKEFYLRFVRRSFEFLKMFLDYRSENEIGIAKGLGYVLGGVMLAKNRIVTSEQFDFKKFVVKSVECRRIRFGVSFITSFLKQGKSGIIFIPNNPWMMSILNLLSEIYSCTPKPVRDEIQGLFNHFSVDLVPREFKNLGLKSKKYLAEYVIEDRDLVVRHVISLALDLSVREICGPIVEKACSVAIQTGMELFRTMAVEKGMEYILFRNMVVNLTKFLCLVSAQEPIRACISGNVSYFMKLCSLDFSTERVFKIAQENQEVCCDLIQKSGASKVSELISTCYNNLEYSNGEPKGMHLSLLEDPGHIEKIVIKAIDNGEYQEIKAHLVQLSKKIPYSKKNIIADEWHGLLNEGREEVFRRILESVESSEDKDEECIRLCRYITGHLIKSGSKEDFLFECMEKIFKISFKTQKEVLGWLIYSNDPRKFSVSLVSKFIEHNLINVVEYDQALSKTPLADGNLDFVISLLTSLITAEVQICTVYDFICTLEMLAGHGDNPRVFDFFQKISNLMMHIEAKGASDYDEYVRSCKFTTVPEMFLPEFMERANYPGSVDIRSAFKVSWDHFIRYHRIPTSYCYLKIDPLPGLIKEKLYESIKESLFVFLEAYRKRNYLFFKLYTRFIVKTLDIMEDTPTNRSLVYSVLEVLSPSQVPGFTSCFLEILGHRFVLRCFDSEEGVILAMEALKCGSYSSKLMYPITQIMQFFKRSSGYVKMYSSYLAYCCPQEYPHVKNFINQFRDRIVPVEGQNPFFRLRTALQNRTSVKVTDLGIGKNLWVYLIDNLNEMDAISSTVIESIKFMIERKMHLEEILTILWIRMKAPGAPKALAACYDEISSFDFCRVFLKSLENHGYNKL
ncbi:cell division control negative transcription regulator [Encephalitozoon intestinalis ATCC 50506]|uniref:Cell division control negative transcription regulator n=1 Tax=Encephalitozoon intestinalis (strain ATCC 50506) TaxID=876142 RepID=E0SA03_ENCIT|nr:cell division control negative transcription regulator [Encephalitozoon intestinalis ATCC 50506]ADM12625.1 cell division control negative transcription regulator [Encephalitozoon intestinalis ATCC 50506]UTX46484.1 CCR4-NOT transcription complex subunit-like protein [Encephalitozoon intestinalis]